MYGIFVFAVAAVGELRGRQPEHGKLERRHAGHSRAGAPEGQQQAAHRHASHEVFGQGHDVRVELAPGTPPAPPPPPPPPPFRLPSPRP